MAHETFTDSLLAAIERDSRSQPKLAADAGIDKASLFRFISSEGELRLRLDSADKLLQALGLEVSLVPRRRNRSRT